MKFSCDLQLLSEVVNNVSLATSAKATTIPALEGILIECTNGKLCLTGFDLDIGIFRTIDVKSEKDGAIVLNAQLFGEMLRKMKGPIVNVSCDERFMTHISDTDTEYNILGINHEEYPSMPKLDEGDEFSVSSPTLKHMINQTLFAVAGNMAQSPILCGSLFKLEKNEFKLISVDGYRVAISKQEIQNDKEMQFVIPSKTLNELCKLLSDDEEDTIDIKITKRHAMFCVGEYKIVSRLLEGTFIDYNAAVPKQTTTTVLVDPKTFASSIERVSIIVLDKISVMMKVKSDTVHLLCESTLGRVNDHFTADIDGDDIEVIAFKNKYMLDALKHCDSDLVKVEMDGPISPIRIVPKDGDNFTFLILPVRLKS